MTFQDRPYWDDAARFPIGTRVRIHLSPEEPAVPDIPDNTCYGEFAADASLANTAHPPGLDGHVGVVKVHPAHARPSLPGHTIFVWLDEPVIVPVKSAVVLLTGVEALRVRADFLAPTELEILESGETP